MKTCCAKWSLALLLCASLPLSAATGKFYFPVGLSYNSGAHEASDEIFDAYERAGWDVDDRFDIPVGLTFNPYYELDFGLGFGLSLGPTAFIYVREETWHPYYGYDEEDRFSYAVPIGAFARYTILREKDVAPYVKVGVRYPIAGGDNIDDSTPGPFGALGVELWRTRKIGMAIEVGYDASEITVKGPSGSGFKKDVTFSGFMAGVSVLF